MIVGAVVMVLGLVPGPLLLEIGAISDTQFLQVANSGYIVTAVGAILFILGIVIGVLGQGAHTEEHDHTVPEPSNQ